ncbi:hypothetical protein V1514DRAFT_332190 [Lipomyces japonicus]|uniref:uncharacterized protein n=1 Tax=Lipomyces japonicus TaxID=56871 RepID=UPI0034CF50B0
MPRKRSSTLSSPLVLSARSNALQFYERRHSTTTYASRPDVVLPSPRHLSLNQRAAFYNLFGESEPFEIESKTATVPSPQHLIYRSLFESERGDDDGDDGDDGDDHGVHGGDNDDGGGRGGPHPKHNEMYHQQQWQQRQKNSSTKVSPQSVLPPSSPAPIMSSAASICSFRSRSSNLSYSRKRKLAPSLASLPLEVVDQICSFLPQSSLLALVQTSKSMACAAYVYLYQSPSFFSTYRFAQFVSVISHDSTLASYVRDLDLSSIDSGFRGSYILAGWRDWKYRSEPLYWTRKSTYKLQQKHLVPRKNLYRNNASFATRTYPGVSLPSPSSSLSSSSSISLSPASTTSSSSSLSSLSSSSYSSEPPPLHPLQSPLLKQYALSRDIPIGAVIHVVRACPHLQHINLSYLPLAADYLVTSKKYVPTAFSSLLFVSDVPKSYTWHEDETTQVYSHRELVAALLELTELRSLKLRNLVWINKDVVSRIVNMPTLPLSYIDCRGCGMTRSNPWAIEGDRSLFLQTLAS